MRKLDKGEAIPYELLLLADEEMQAIERYIHQSDIYVIELEQIVVGVCALYRVNAYTTEIKAIAVAEMHQDKGLGKLMLKAAAAKALEQGYRELIIGTPTTAEKQLAIYKNAGFELFAVRKDFFITHYAAPIFENGVQLKDMAVLRKQLLP